MNTDKISINIAIEPNMEFTVWSPYDCYEAADTMLTVMASKSEESEANLDENAQIDAKIEQYRQEGKLRPIGLCAGEFVVTDDFNDPLPDEIIDLF
ncbi:MAG: hypothetical protein F6J93_32135 [Oscillatoria sp. SIO1A7]|nr:hypothetical protein [Oscillatoria sp. SIO1A7]